VFPTREGESFATSKHQGQGAPHAPLALGPGVCVEPFWVTGLAQARQATRHEALTRGGGSTRRGARAAVSSGQRRSSLQVAHLYRVGPASQKQRRHSGGKQHGVAAAGWPCVHNRSRLGHAGARARHPAAPAGAVLLGETRRMQLRRRRGCEQRHGRVPPEGSVHEERTRQDPSSFLLPASQLP
jgi:hypothetical protein